MLQRSIQDMKLAETNLFCKDVLAGYCLDLLSPFTEDFCYNYNSSSAQNKPPFTWLFPVTYKLVQGCLRKQNTNAQTWLRFNQAYLENLSYTQVKKMLATSVMFCYHITFGEGRNVVDMLTFVEFSSKSRNLMRMRKTFLFLCLFKRIEP